MYLFQSGMCFLARLAAYALAFLSIANCNPWRSSPYSDETKTKVSHLNTKFLGQIGFTTHNPLKIAVISDTHQNYSDLGKVIKQINSTPGIDFVAHLGDFTNNSYNFEYDYFLKYYLRLRYPSFIVPGNHDLLGAGRSLYRRIFGQMNYYFETDHFRFVFFHSNNWEDPSGFNPQWLKATVEDSTKRVVILSHVPLYDKERYKGATAQLFEDVLNDPKVVLALNGHNHGYLIGNYNNAVTVQCPRVERRRWLLMTLSDTDVTVTRYPENQSWQASF